MEQPSVLLLAELGRIRQLVEMMESQLLQHSTGEPCMPLLQKLLSSVHCSILMAQSNDPAAGSGDFPRIETSEAAVRKEMTKKRKTLLKWSSQVRVVAAAAAAAGGFEGAVDDGFSWRKYGQKQILGAKNPRGYYRCTHRMTKGCPATKQVQRSDQDPLLFHVVYHGHHTCCFSSSAAASAGNILSSSPENNCLGGGGGGGGGGGPSPAALPSPATSDSTHFSISPQDLGREMKLWSPESGANSAADSAPAEGMELLLEELDFEGDFSSFFS